MAEEARVSLANLLGGVAVERFDDELTRVLANIVDRNTQAEAKREIVLKMSFKPDKMRDMGKVEIQVSSKLAPAEKLGTRMFIAITKTGPVATEYDPRQPLLPMNDPAPVVPLRSAPTGGGQ